MRQSIEAFFGFSERNAVLSVELSAGVSTFLALSYIFVVNPTILASAGVPRNAAFFATVCASALATFCMGVWARLPFAVAPGLEMNAYVAASVVGTYGFHWQQALGLCFLSSLLMIGVTVSRLRARFLESIPTSMKTSLAAMVGVFVGLIALQLTHVIAYDGGHLSAIHSPFNSAGAVLAIGTIVVLVLDRNRVRTAVIASIAVATLSAHLLGLAESPAALGGSGGMLDAAGAMSFGGLAGPQALSVILVLFLLDFFGSAAKFIGLSAHTEIMAGGEVPRLTRGLSIDGASSALGASLGTSTLTTFVESGVGIRAGARTGLSAVICALLMLAVLPFAQVASYVPVVATTGALVFVAVSLWPSRAALATQSPTDRIVLAVMLAVVIATFALDWAILAGFTVYILGAFIRRSHPNRYMVGSAILLMFGIVLQHA